MIIINQQLPTSLQYFTQNDAPCNLHTNIYGLNYDDWWNQGLASDSEIDVW